MQTWKKYFLSWSLLCLIFTSCETEFDVNSDWQETTVIYGLLNASSDTQYVKINKAFLGNVNAVQIASISDSIHYDPSDLNVSLHKIIFNDTLETLVFDTSLVIKDSLDINGNLGLFSLEDNIVYKVFFPNGFLNKNSRYSIRQ